jgi:phosphate transport system permease protein
VSSPPPAADRSLIGGRAPSETVALWVFRICGFTSVLATFGILVVLLGDGIGFFRAVSLRQFLFDTEWTPLFDEKHFGIWPLVAGTAVTTLIAMVVAVPLGLLAAVYLSEFASVRAR